MNDSLFVSLDRLLLEFECFEDIKEYKATVCKIHETINTTDEEIGHYCKHSKEIKDNCSNACSLSITYQLDTTYIARHYEKKNLTETLEEKSKKVEKRKELKERIFEKDPQPVLMLNKTAQNSQLFLPYESQKLVKPIKMHSSEPRVIDKKEESSVSQSKLANIDFKQKENDAHVLNDSAVNNHPKCTHVTAFKNSQNIMQFRLVTPQKQSDCNQWLEKRDTDLG
ncbi:hypothetical protein MJG53_008542 [Ovis ammon polii x Ovis aries]|uniref:Uncharacterized protein n=2 Tax=Ovis TaxID=9935 RepID=A0AAD4YAZ0_OVIAM|nr:hypothetical protein MG293_009683 [Ovis ammon polii]KAI4568313.1 hypothetical protein MJT46_008111 [Ovis ammon polii x Ovis aries]KAI4583329.1 hypothetical protein MJG53_008542 [Ovis ammon polii x Ovis aries]